MLPIVKKYIILYFVPVLFAMSTQAQTDGPESPKKTLSVGVAGSEPFVSNEPNKGIAVEIWNDIAAAESWDYTYLPYESVDEALHDLTEGNLDLVVGPVSITASRLEDMRFSQPFYNSSISIISRMGEKSIWQKVKPLFSARLLIAVGIFLVILAIVGTLLWLAERKESPEQFPKDPVKGIGNGMWLAIVTMSTTGYGDKAAVTLMGRIISGTWMVVSIIFATSMVAGIASTLTLSSLGSTTISNIEQLSGAKAATISGSPAEAFLKKNKIKVTEVSNLEEAIAKLKSKDVNAVVYDRPQLLYFLKNNKNEDLYISKAEYYKQGYGFAFPLNSELTTDVNKALLELSENQQIERIVHYYIEKDE